MITIDDLYTIYPVFGWDEDDNRFLPLLTNIIAVFKKKEDMIKFCDINKDNYFLIFGCNHDAYDGFNTHVGTLIIGLKESFHCQSDKYDYTQFCATY